MPWLRICKRRRRWKRQPSSDLHQSAVPIAGTLALVDARKGRGHANQATGDCQGPTLDPVYVALPNIPTCWRLKR